MQGIKNKFLHNKMFFVIGVIILILGSLSYELQPKTKLMVCLLMSTGEGRILHSFPSPDPYFTINVVEVECGQSHYDGTIYKCSTRLDLKLADGRVIRGYEKNGQCDATVKWLSDWMFEVKYPNGYKEKMDTIYYGILP